LHDDAIVQVGSGWGVATISLQTISNRSPSSGGRPAEQDLGQALYAPQRLLHRRPCSPSPTRVVKAVRFLRAWINKAPTVAVAATHSQQRWPACFQPVSSTCLTGAARTAATASAWAGAKASLICCSRWDTVPKATGTSKTVSTTSSRPRLLT